MLYDFDKTTYKIFKFINSRNPTAVDRIFSDYDYLEEMYVQSCIDYLRELGLVYLKNKDGYDYLVVSARGKAYFKYKWRDIFDKYLTIVISVVSFGMSVAAFVISLLNP